MPCTLPESYSAYVADAAVRTAVDHILDRGTIEVPETLDWNQLPDLHTADLGAHQVRCEYASALLCLWNAVWRRALDQFDSCQDLEPLSISETQQWYEFSFDPKSLWHNGAFARGYRIAGFKMGLGVSLDVHEARLCLWFGNEDDDDCVARRLSRRDWDPDFDDTFGYWTTKDMARIAGGHVELDRFNSVADRALAAIRGNPPA